MRDDGSTTLGFQIFMVVMGTKREKKRGSSQSNRREMKDGTYRAPPSWRLKTLIIEIRRTNSVKVVSISDDLDVWVGRTPVAVASDIYVEERDDEQHLWGSSLMVAENPNH
ncbi:hypothetical protein L2E82_14860 [Cichorium intybus]|uniref:Uncharacterized protein n=1 Tax=Cichorium intybus TaxID=13427 RepID=A0ACB9F0J8_CICIN|nr:hypothetical protein L2E82_14860 [Cichorium intybus]